jgi:PIN domain nuclease of toxin-antitoxin system
MRSCGRQAGGRRLSRRASTAINAARTLLVSPLTCWEVGTLHRLGRIVLDREPSAWVADLLRTGRITLAELTPSAATSAGLLDGSFAGDPIDRLLYATAQDHRVPLLAKDESLRAFAASTGDVKVIW